MRDWNYALATGNWISVTYSVGLPARFIELGSPQSPTCHFTTEVYLREHKKWAVVDATPLPECDLYYAARGVPQSSQTSSGPEPLPGPAAGRVSLRRLATTSASAGTRALMPAPRA